MVARRATRLAEGTWTPPSDITADPIAAQPVGQIYNTVRHGIRKMPGYGSQIPTRDRWAIVGYVRALQRSTRGRLQDVPEDQRDALR
jgi:mono/diheme cytochrome c family protein